MREKDIGVNRTLEECLVNSGYFEKTTAQSVGNVEFLIRESFSHSGFLGKNIIENFTVRAVKPVKYDIVSDLIHNFYADFPHFIFMENFSFVAIKEECLVVTVSSPDDRKKTVKIAIGKLAVCC